ncbi:MAG: acyl-CoA thioesterase [Candidatus Nanopelagicaceae bacterium]|nr:acyl-CoA thioesterase [Candidatus Nanopelagicaceae bacterium]
MKFTSKIYVRWADLDAFGHVNNAHYLTYAELARVDWAGKQFAPKEGSSVLVEMTVAHSEVDYLIPITNFGFNYDVNLWVESIGDTSFTVAYEVLKDGVVYAKMKTVQVMIDIDKMKSRPINATEREFLTKYLASS